MKELLKEFITDILSLSEAVPATHNPGDVWRTKGPLSKIPNELKLLHQFTKNRY